MQEALRFGLCRVTLTAQENAVLPEVEHVGALLHDRLGAALKHTGCAFSQRECLDRCLLPTGCAYARVFKPTQSMLGTGDGHGGEDVPRPFVLEPPDTSTRRYAPGETLTFHLVLLGEALALFPFFARALQEMAHFGLSGSGGTRPAWQLTRIAAVDHREALNGPTLFPLAADQLLAGLPSKSWADLKQESLRLDVQEITLDFQTPLRLRQQDELATALTAAQVGHALRRRLRLLMRFWGENGNPALSEAMQAEAISSEIGDAAAWDAWTEEIQGEAHEIIWEEWTRHSVRQKRILPLGGVRGRLVLRGPLGPWRFWLKCGEYLHLGGQTTLGLGRYVCRS